MKQYIGTKTLMAEPMTLGQYNLSRSWVLPANEDPTTMGYRVQYPDGYISWSPKKQFEEAYASDGNFDFGHALFLMNEGAKVARSGWNGKGMFIFLTKGREVPNDGGRSFAHFEANPVVLADHIDMHAADGSFVSGWNPSQVDMRATDWGIVPDA